jgi:nitrate/nitrite transport system substrate-binding protein
MLGLSTGGVWAAGSDKPEKEEIKIGFIPLTDCASVVMASVLGFDKKYGVKFVLSKEASGPACATSWPMATRCSPCAVRPALRRADGHRRPEEGHGGADEPEQQRPGHHAVEEVADKGGVDGASLAKLMRTDKREYTFAQTFPTGTHAMWLYYWLAANGINPMKDAKVITVPPPQMVANMRVGQHGWLLRGAVGPPRHHGRRRHHRHHHPGHLEGPPGEGAGHHAGIREEISQHLPRHDGRDPEAGKWIDASLANKNKMAEIADKSYVNTSKDAIDQRIMGRYQNGLGKTWDDPNHMKFYNDGAVNFPYLSDGMWFMTQHRRWGLLKDDPDYWPWPPRSTRSICTRMPPP